MVIGLIRAKPAGPAAGSGRSWHGGSNTTQASDPGSKDPVVRLSLMLGQTTLVAEQQQSLKRCLELAKAEALSAFDRVGFLESLAVCTDEGRAMQKHQDRCAAAFEAFDTALLHHHGTQQLASLSEEEQQQVAATKAQLRDELSSIAAAAVQQVKAAATARRRSATDRDPKHQQQQQAAEAVLRGFKAQLQQIEDDCTDVAAAKQACKAAVTKSLDSFKSQAAAAGSTAPQAVLLFKGQLEQHAQHVLAAVKHRAAALGFEAQHAAATPSTAPAAAGTSTAPHDAWWHQQGSASQHTVMLQQAHEQCAERVEGDRKLLGEAAQRAVQLMQLEVAKLQAKGWPNAFLAGRLVEDARSQAHAEFIKLAARQHSFAPDSKGYQQQLVQVEAALASAKEQTLSMVQAAASQTATAAAATLGNA